MTRGNPGNVTAARDDDTRSRRCDNDTRSRRCDDDTRSRRCDNDTRSRRCDNDARGRTAANEETLARLVQDGTAIHHEAHGHGAPILLTHGFGATSRMWDEQIEEFTDRYQLILWDLPGHGESPAPGRGASPDSLVDNMTAILDAEGAASPVLIGLGAGGTLALRFWRANPERVRALVLIGTMPGLRSGMAREIWNGQVEALAASLERDGLDALEGGCEVDPRLHGSPPGLAAAARALLIQHDDGALPWLAEIDVPVLIVVGSEDRPNLTAAHFMARTIPNAREVVITRANHAANVHKPDAVNAAIREFLGRLPR
jgi:pimeloyl-ACP methyl ester carboxylesterase